MRRKVKKPGNSAEEDGRVVTPPSYSLDDLLDQMTPDVIPEDIDFGPPVGKEVW